jgi:23S rRNA (uridine2552-2'-O)-methyltransferase
MTKKPQNTKTSKTSKEWLKRHFADPYVKKSWESKYRSRAAFKLLEIQEKDRIIKPCMTVVDLGAAPGSWSQVVQSVIGSKGKIFALDILPMDPINDVSIITGDFTDEAVLKQLEDELGGEKVDLVLSDIAPNKSGHKSVDQPKSIYLNELALDFAINHLKPGGDFLCKVFQGVGSQEFHQSLRDNFTKVITRKPKASRDSSTEIYLLGKTLK